MTRSQAIELAGKFRSSWPRTFMADEDIRNWAEFLERYEIDEGMFALAVMQERYADADLSIARVVGIIEGDRARRFKCPVCGIGWPSEERVREHRRNVHYEAKVAS